MEASQRFSTAIHRKEWQKTKGAVGKMVQGTLLLRPFGSPRPRAGQPCRQRCGLVDDPGHGCQDTL